MSSGKLQCTRILCRGCRELLRPDMKPFLWLLSAVLSLQCVNSQISMVEFGPGIVRPPETLDVTCKVTGASLTDSTNMACVHWVRQPEGKGLEWLGAICYDNTKYHAQSVQGRMTLTRDTNKGEAYSKFTGVKREESGKYFCARQQSGYSYFDKWGPGIMVTVTSATEQAPSLFPLISCGTSHEPTVTIGCLARDFLPETINFSWNDKSNNSFSNGLKTFKSVLQTSGTYAASSLIQVTTESWEKPDPYYCVAKHSLNTKVLQVGNKVVRFTSPIVTMAAPVKDDLYTNGNGTIVCIMSNYYPNNIKVKWLNNHVETTLNTMTDKPNANGEGNFVLSSFMTVSKNDWDEDTIFSCVVEHSASSFFEIRNVSKSQSCETSAGPGLIQVDVVPPSFESIFLNKKAPLTCVISNMASPEGLDVSWYELGSDLKLDTVLDKKPVYQNGAYSIKATASVCADDWLKKTFECRVKHPDLTSPKKITLAKDHGQEPKTPTVLLYPPHQDELNRKESVTLTCVAKHFYPADIFVKWTSNDQIDDRYVVTTKPMLEPYSSDKKSYFVYSTLTIPSIEIWNSGKSYTCVVAHESLPLQATQRSIDKTTGKATAVNVSLVMSDSC